MRTLPATPAAWRHCQMMRYMTVIEHDTPVVGKAAESWSLFEAVLLVRCVILCHTLWPSSHDICHAGSTTWASGLSCTKGPSFMYFSNACRRTITINLQVGML